MNILTLISLVGVYLISVCISWKVIRWYIRFYEITPTVLEVVFVLTPLINVVVSMVIYSVNHDFMSSTRSDKDLVDTSKFFNL